jgi:integrase
MAQPKFTLYKYVKLQTGWRYCKAAFHENSKIKPNIVIVGKDKHEEKHPEGSYYLAHAGQWIPVGDDALKAERRRRERVSLAEYQRLSGTAPMPSSGTATASGRTTLLAAAAKYFSNLEARGLDAKTIRTYRTGVDPFVENCGKPYVEDVTKQDMINFMGWLRKQPLPKRRNSNPDRTYANKVGYVAIFLKTFSVSRLLKKSEYPQYEEKMVTAHSDEELDYLYSHADAERRFLLDFGLNSGFRDGELSHAEYTDLVGNMLEVKRKPHMGWKPKKHHCRKVTVSQKFADAFRARGKKSETSLVFLNEAGKPNQHLLRDLQALTPNDKPFHTELHKLRKTWATRLAHAGMSLDVLQKRLGHKSLATTQKYLADVDLSSKEHSDLVEKATYTPMPKVVKKSGTHGD